MSDSSEKTQGLFILIGIVCFIGLIYVIFGGEREGTVNNTTDCQQEIIIKDAFYNRIFRRFLCYYDKTDNGKLVGGECTRATFDNNGNCTKLITYEKTPGITCAYGKIINYTNGNCECSESQTMRNGSCYDKCGSNATYNYSDKLCYCDYGYENNTDRSKCVPVVIETPLIENDYPTME